MKKLWITLLVLMLFGCTQKPTETPDDLIDTSLTPFEQIQEAKSRLDLGVDLNDVRKNLVLPKTFEYEESLILISWRSSDRITINDEGHVNRPAPGSGHKTLVLTATFVLLGSRDYMEYLITVPELPFGDLGLVEEASEALVVYPKPTIDQNFIILPRVGDFGTHITWETSDSNIISLDGHVNLPLPSEPDKIVTLSASISLGTAMTFKDFSLIVKAPSKTYGQEITLDDPRIIRIVAVNEKIMFLTALLAAKPGDAIVLEDGNYYDVNIEMKNSGTEEHPIFIMARNPGNAKIMGESQLYVKADHVIIAHLNFTNGSPTTDRGAIWLEGNHLRLTNTLIDHFETRGNDYKWVSLTGQYHEIDHNTFDGKETGGALLTIWRDDMGPQYHKIHHNQFKNYKDAGGVNGYETIRVGTSTYSQSDAYVTIEYNLFEAVSGEIEIISIKAGRVHVRGNTFISSLGHITTRHGKNNVIEDNVFFANGLVDSGGIRAYDGGHVIRNNYIDSVNTGSNTRAGIVIHSGVNEIGTSTVLNAQWTSFNMLIERNTIVNSRQSILFDGKYSQPAHDIILKDNLIIAQSGQYAMRYDKLPIRAIFENNYVYSDLGYAGGGAVSTVAVPQGMIFSMVLLEINPNTQGMKLHPTYGAQNLTRIHGSTSGVSWLRNT